MGNKSGRNLMTAKMAWRLVDRLAAALDANERDEVLGDIAESGESGGWALLDIFGLVVRREAAMWREWRPWVVLAALVIPFSILISVLSRMVSGETSVYFWMYLNNWDWDLLRNSGFWHELPSAAFVVLKNCLTLACWSWGIGFAVGLASRRTVRANGILLCFMLLLGEAVLAPLYLAYFCRNAGLPAPTNSNDPVFGLLFYRVMFPFLVLVVLVAAPALLGTRQSAHAKAHGGCAIRVGSRCHGRSDGNCGPRTRIFVLGQGL